MNSRLITLPKYTNNEYDQITLIRVHIENNTDRVSGLNDLLNKLVASTTDKATEEVYRIARRFREELDGLIDCHDDVRRLVAIEDDFEPWKRLTEIFHCTLRQIQLRLAELVEKDSQSNSTLRVRLDMEAPIAMGRLGHW